MENSLNLTHGMLEQAAKSPSAAALQMQAQENGITLTAEEAATCYAQLHPETGAISDEELDNVSGGCGPSKPTKCRFCDHTEFTSIYVDYGLRWVCDNCGKYD